MQEIDAGAPSAAIEVRGLSFYYGRFRGLADVSLDVARNRVTAFIGPSGCGKSTLLRTFNRMFDLYPNQRAEGEIRMMGRNVLDPSVDVNLLRAKVGMVFQKPTPFPMTIFENIAFGVRLYEKLSHDAMQDRVEWALRKAALWEEVKDKLDASGLSLSGGQQQRLCIARMVAVKPEVLLLDEPTSALDLRWQLQVLQAVRAQVTEARTLAVIAVHDLNLALRFCDRIVVLGQGQAHNRLLAAGRPAEVLTPALLQAAYGVRARVEHCSLGHPLVLADEALPPTDDPTP